MGWSAKFGAGLLAALASGAVPGRAQDVGTTPPAPNVAPEPAQAPAGLWPAVDDLRDRLEADGWLIQGQFTGIYQGHGRFKSPYTGADSLTSDTRPRETLSFGPLIGRRLWDGAALYFGPEFDQGFGLNSTVGAAAFPNGEAFRAGTKDPRLNYERLFIRQYIGFGGAQETIERDQLQFEDTVDIDRLTLTLGKVSVWDLFDDNKYSHDPRTQFMNWALMAAGAIDFAADAKGYTDGLGLDYNQRDWAARWGIFQVAARPNSKAIDEHVLDGWQMLGELEQRFALFDRPGRVRELAMLDRTHAIVYSAFAGLAPVNAGDPLYQARRYRENYGIELNLEQELAADVGLFGRLSWNPGRVQEYMFTEVDRSASLGVSIKGLRWGRPDDTVGLGGVLNGLSENHRSFLAAGNTGFIVGDGQLNYAAEQVIESYYSFQLLPGTAFSFDYQFLNNPGYNADRGPVSVFAVRFHAEY